MAIKIRYDREDYIRAVKTLGETIARRAEDIVPDNLSAVAEIEIRGSVKPGTITMFSWTVKAFAEDEDGRIVAIIDSEEQKCK